MWKTLTRVIYHNAKRLFYNYLFEQKNNDSDEQKNNDSDEQKNIMTPIIKNY